ncbi:N-acetyldiaminopimelate deacetylase [Oceanobacillus halotolerans]|uniref:N-acetyldiaminopimelate deacetylase n=1 Tax=Oceanobacillus halotolerans TaxID=2663380 RepID=UPI0013DA60CC|nr:N-acetyldiaminopimelate deacetylase [Oceanobacillus halotolerans]
MEFSTLQTIRRELHQIPELGFQEVKTQFYLLEKIKEMQTDNVSIETWKTGILVHVQGKKPTKTIGFRCDIDGLPMKEETDYDFQSVHEGNMHACGHDFHMTIALGALQKTIDERPNDHVLFIFQPAEEGPGGALPMLKADIFQKWKPDCIFALHIAPEMPVGTVSSKPGLLFANTNELFIDFNGKGGHAAYPHLTKDMTVAASNFIVQMQQIISRNIDPLDSAVITIGKMESGFVQNVIAETARLEGTIRTLNADAMNLIKTKLEKMANGFEISNDCSVHINYGAQYYQVYNDRTYVDQFAKVIHENTSITYKEASTAMTGEDFGYMLKEIPGFMYWLGVDSPYGLHHTKLQPKEKALLVGVDSVLETIQMLSV